MYYMLGLFAALISFFVATGDKPVYTHEDKPCRTVALAQDDFFFMSDDQGATWQGIGAGIPEDVLSFCFWVEDDLCYLGSNEGVFLSSTMLPSRGWEKSTLEKEHINQINHGKEGPLVISGPGDISQFRHAVSRWRSLSHNLSYKNVYTILETQDKALWVGSDQGIFRTRNEGRSWEQVFEHYYVTQIVESGHLIIAHSSNGVWVSADQGDTWKRTIQAPDKTIKLVQLEDRLLAIMKGIELCGMSAPNYLMESKDQGMTWQTAAYTLPTSLHGIYDILPVGADLYACGSSGIYKSSDAGHTWMEVLLNPRDSGGFFKLQSTGKKLFALKIQGC